jgi:signal transduction histidine kinase
MEDGRRPEQEGAGAGGPPLHALETLVERSAHGMAVADGECRLRRVNPAFAALWGREPGELLGRRPAEALPGGGAAVEGACALVLRTAAPVEGVEVEGMEVGGAGGARWRLSCFPVADGVALLVEPVAAAPAELPGGLDGFVAAASHELRTPLTVVLGQAQILERRLRAEGLGEQLLRPAQIIVQQTTRMARMIGGLVDLSQIEAGRLSVARGPVDLRAVAERLAAEAQAATRRHQLVVTGEPGPLLALGDEARLEYALHQLVGNAVKFSPAGGQVELGLLRRGALVGVAVRDGGIGVPREAAPRLFERFFRAPNAQARGLAGPGLGLYVAGELARLHGGEVAATSVEGEGSVFTLWLPGA